MSFRPSDRILTPHFIIGGAPRSGTTFLGSALARHPLVRLARPLIPEPKVFTVPAADEHEYLPRYRAFFGPGDDGFVRGEKTSYYLESAESCELIARHLPAVRLVFIVREPASRAYSNYLWSRQNGLETLSFTDAIRLEDQRQSPLPAAQAYARPFSYAWRGRYADFAEPYLHAFGPDRILFLLYEDLAISASTLLRRVQEFVGVDPDPAVESSLSAVNAALDEGLSPEPGVQESLRVRFRDQVERFAALTGLDVRAWGY